MSEREYSNIIEAKNLTIKFPTSSEAVFENLSFQVPRGSIYGIFGETGCGKSTLAQYIIGFIPSSLVEGKIYLHFQDQKNVPLHHYNEFNWRKLRGEKIVYIPQDPYKTLNPYERVGKQLFRSLIFRKKKQSSRSFSLYPFIQMLGKLVNGSVSVKDVRECRDTFFQIFGKINVSREDREELKDILAQVGLSYELSERFPHTLSAGQKQRIMLAHAIILEPELLILDEPTASIDPKGRKILQDCFHRLLKKGVTLLLISHELQEYEKMIPRNCRLYFSQILPTGVHLQRSRRKIPQNLLLTSLSYN